MSATPLTIVQISGLGDVGDLVYRVHEPADALGRQGDAEVFTVHSLSRYRDEAAIAADVAVIYLTMDVELFRVIHLRRLLGRPTLCEINDNFFDVHPWNPAHAKWADPRGRKLFVELMSRSDAVQVSTPALAERFRRYNSRIEVLPNQIAWLPARRAPRDSGRLVVGWGGSAGHLRDLERIAPTLTRWVAAHSGARLAIMGDPLFASFFSDLPRDRFRFEPGGSLERYLDFVATLDVGIAPLLPTEYNRCRSDVKFLEYAAHGVVPVLQRLDPYSASVRDGETGFVFDDGSELGAVLDRLAVSPALRQRVAAAAYDHVRTDRVLERHVGKRLELYRSAADRARAEPPATGTDAIDGLAEAAALPLRSLPGLERRGPGCWQLDLASDAERSFSAALDALDSRDGARAAAGFTEATRLAPDYYQAHFFLGHCLSRQGQAVAAEHAFETAARINPLYSRPLRALARLHGGLADEYARRSARLNPPLG